MKEAKDEKAKVNPAARHDTPGALEPPVERPRTPNRQVRAQQGEEMNPLDPGGIGD
jgi:hypothetical protein